MPLILKSIENVEHCIKGGTKTILISATNMAGEAVQIETGKDGYAVLLDFLLTLKAGVPELFRTN